MRGRPFCVAVGAGVLRGSLVGQSGKHVPFFCEFWDASSAGDLQGKRVPFWTRIAGQTFRLKSLAESPSRNPGAEWDAFSGWRARRKMHPRFDALTWMHFPVETFSGKFIPEFGLGTGWGFRLSFERKTHPRMAAGNGMPFPGGPSIPFAVEAGRGQSAPMFPNEYAVSRGRRFSPQAL